MLAETIVRAHTRATRRLRTMCASDDYAGPEARLYVEAERLIEALRGQEPTYSLTPSRHEVLMGAVWEATQAELDELEEADAQDARPWDLPDIPLAECEMRLVWGDR